MAVIAGWHWSLAREGRAVLRGETGADTFSRLPLEAAILIWEHGCGIIEFVVLWCVDIPRAAVSTFLRHSHMPFWLGTALSRRRRLQFISAPAKG
jgi:hypothetical protein